MALLENASLPTGIQSHFQAKQSNGISERSTSASGTQLANSELSSGTSPTENHPSAFFHFLGCFQTSIVRASTKHNGHIFNINKILMKIQHHQNFNQDHGLWVR
jgi:hypothetical protein